LRLTLLAPDIVEAILDGRQPEGMTLPGLMKGVKSEWGRQGRSVSVHEIAVRTSGGDCSPLEQSCRSMMRNIQE
jgi:hypothetical protein